MYKKKEQRVNLYKTRLVDTEVTESEFINW